MTKKKKKEKTKITLKTNCKMIQRSFKADKNSFGNLLLWAILGNLSFSEIIYCFELLICGGMGVAGGGGDPEETEK